MEKTVILLKPDALQRGLIGELIARFEKKGLKIVALKFKKFEAAIFEDHYAHHKDKPFFADLVGFMVSTPLICIVVEGIEAIAMVRKMLGATNGRNAEFGTIRGDFSVSTSANLVHASEDAAAAQAEIKRFFDEEEIYSWDRTLDSFFYADDELK